MAGKTSRRGKSSKFKVQSSIEASTPKNDLFPDEAISAHLEKVSWELKSAKDKTDGDLREVLERVFVQLSSLQQKSHAAEKLEESLEKLDALIDTSLLRNFETEMLRGEIEKQIAYYKNKMDSEIYERTFDLMLLKRLRENAGIPRLSLFHL